MEKLRDKLARRMREYMRSDLTADTQTKVADKSGVSQSSVQRLLARDQSATVDMLEQLARAFSVKRPECLLLEDDEIALLTAWGKLSEAERVRVLGYIEVAGRTPEVQLSIDTARHVRPLLQPSQQAAAGRSVPPELRFKNATEEKGPASTKRRKS